MLLKLISLVSFYFADVSARQLKITYWVPIIFLLDSVDLENEYMQDSKRFYQSQSFYITLEWHLQRGHPG